MKKILRLAAGLFGVLYAILQLIHVPRATYLLIFSKNSYSYGVFFGTIGGLASGAALAFWGLRSKRGGKATSETVPPPLGVQPGLGYSKRTTRESDLECYKRDPDPEPAQSFGFIDLLLVITLVVVVFAIFKVVTFSNAQPAAVQTAGAFAK